MTMSGIIHNLWGFFFFFSFVAGLFHLAECPQGLSML